MLRWLIPAIYACLNKARVQQETFSQQPVLLTFRWYRLRIGWRVWPLSRKREFLNIRGSEMAVLPQSIASNLKVPGWDQAEWSLNVSHFLTGSANKSNQFCENVIWISLNRQAGTQWDFYFDDKDPLNLFPDGRFLCCLNVSIIFCKYLRCNLLCDF